MKINKDNRGFSLLELIVTVVILAIVTAPFLSSFVTASNTNVKSKRIQEANELSQYVIEQCKAMSLDKIENEYSATKDANYKIDSGSSVYDKVSTKYTWTIDNTELPSGYSDNYSADVEIVPIKAIINSNEAIPEIDDVNKKGCTVLKEKINKFDASYSSLVGGSKKLAIEISYDSTIGVTKPYSVKYQLDYMDFGNVVQGTHTETFSYTNIPSVYLLYAPMSVNDRIEVVNNIPNDKFSSGEKVNVYIMKQKCFIGDLDINKISFSELSSSYTLNSLIYGSDSAKLNNTIIYTNIKDTTGLYNDKGDTVNDTIKTIKIDTLYDIDVTIKYSGKEVSKFRATKIEMK
ncbi:MAG: type II secretion system protein [Lachnospiraceae bacterium]|nr:type II secretion system protein [Lachnospiraceae bacterium]